MSKNTLDQRLGTLSNENARETMETAYTIVNPKVALTAQPIGVQWSIIPAESDAKAAHHVAPKSDEGGTSEASRLSDVGKPREASGVRRVYRRFSHDPSQMALQSQFRTVAFVTLISVTQEFKNSRLDNLK